MSCRAGRALLGRAMDGLGVAIEEDAAAGQEPYAMPRLGTEGAPAHRET
jgi:hypothetical protein